MPITSTTDFMTFRDISRRIPISEKTLRNKASLGTLPFPSVMIMGRRVVRISDYDTFVSGLYSNDKPPVPSAPVELAPVAKKRGRTSNAEKAQRAADSDSCASDLFTDTEVSHE